MHHHPFKAPEIRWAVDTLRELCALVAVGLFVTAIALWCLPVELIGIAGGAAQ